MQKLTFSAPGVVYTYPREASWFTTLPAITNAASMPYAFDKLANWMLLRSVCLSRIDRFSLGPIEEGSKRGCDGSRGAGVLARGTRSCT